MLNFGKGRVRSIGGKGEFLIRKGRGREKKVYIWRNYGIFFIFNRREARFLRHKCEKDTGVDKKKRGPNGKKGEGFFREKALHCRKKQEKETTEEKKKRKISAGEMGAFGKGRRVGTGAEEGSWGTRAGFFLGGNLICTLYHYKRKKKRLLGGEIGRRITGNWGDVITQNMALITWHWKSRKYPGGDLVL